MDKLTDYIGYYEDIVPDMLCKQLMWYSFDFKPSKFANHYGDMASNRSSERVRMDDVWINDESSFHPAINECFDKVVTKFKHPHLNIERKTFFSSLFSHFTLGLSFCAAFFFSTFAASSVFLFWNDCCGWWQSMQEK